MVHNIPTPPILQPLSHQSAGSSRRNPSWVEKEPKLSRAYMWILTVWTSWCFKCGFWLCGHRDATSVDFNCGHRDATSVDFDCVDIMMLHVWILTHPEAKWMSPLPFASKVIWWCTRPICASLPPFISFRAWYVAVWTLRRRVKKIWAHVDCAEALKGSSSQTHKTAD